MEKQSERDSLTNSCEHFPFEVKHSCVLVALHTPAGFLSAPCGICPQLRSREWESELQTFPRIPSSHMPLSPSLPAERPCFPPRPTLLLRSLSPLLPPHHHPWFTRTSHSLRICSWLENYSISIMAMYSKVPCRSSIRSTASDITPWMAVFVSDTLVQAASKSQVIFSWASRVESLVKASQATFIPTQEISVLPAEPSLLKSFSYNVQK